MSTYSVETMLEGVGTLKHRERGAVRQVLGFGAALSTDQDTKQLHLFWTVTADSMDEAVDTARLMHRAAKEATGVYIPHTTLFAVREVDTG